MNIKKRIVVVFSFLLMILFFSCDELVKKNEEEFMNKNDEGFRGLNFIMNSQDFMAMQQNLMVFTNNRKHLYTCNDGVNTTIFVFDTFYPGSVFNRREAAFGRRHLAVSPDDKFLYTTDGGNYVYVYKINDSGTITYKGEVFNGLLSSIRFIAVSPDNSYLYILGMYSGSSALILYKKDIESGKLGSVRFQYLSFTFDKFSFSPDSRFMYLSTMSQPSFQWYEMNYKSGYMTYRGSLGLMVNSFSITNNGSFLYLSTGGNMIEAYERNKDNGNLKYLTSASTGMSVNSIFASPDSRTLYALTGAATTNIEIFNLNNSGKFSGYFIYSNGSVLNYGLTMDFTYGGRFLYVLCYNSYNISVFGIGDK